MNKATLSGIFALVLWAILALMTVETKRIPPFQLLFMTFAIASLIGLGKMAYSRDFTPLKQPAIVYLHGLYGLFLYHFCFFMALRIGPPATALLINALWCLLIVLFSTLLPQGRFQLNHVLGGLIGLGALILLVGFDINNISNLGLFFALSCAFIWSSYSVSAVFLKKVPTETIAGICLLTALLALISHISLETAITEFTNREIIAVLLISIGPMGLAFYFWDYASKYGNMSLIGAISYAAPVMGMVLLAVFGHADLTARHFIAVGLIILSAIIASRSKK